MASQLSYTVVNVTQTSGQSVDLHCPVNLSKSWPLPTVDWYEFGTGDKLLNEHGVKLTVLKAGLYQCTASNSVGSAWHTFLVVTKGISEKGHCLEECVLFTSTTHNAYLQY